MSDAISSFLDSLFSAVIALLSISFIALTITIFSKYDKFLIGRNDDKSSSHYTTAYLGYENDYTSAMALNDILSSDVEYIVINGTAISESMLKGAREGSETDISAIKSYLTGNYVKSYAFDSNGNMTGLAYASH